MSAPVRPHTAIRIDALPPDADPDRRFYRCTDGCEYLTGPQLQASTIPHQIPDPAQLLSEHYGTDVTAAAAEPRRGAA
jgi:hypothetical protein